MMKRQVSETGHSCCTGSIVTAVTLKVEAGPPEARPSRPKPASCRPVDWSAEALSCRNGSLFTERTGFAFMSLDDVDVELGSPREGEALTQAQLDLLYRDGFVVCVFFSAAPPMRRCAAR